MTDPAARLRAEGLSPGFWSNGPGDRYPSHRHDYDKVLVCAAGSIRFRLTDDGRDIDLGVGDRLDLPAGAAHSAIVGAAGVTCLEVHLREGSIGAAARRPAGDW